MNNLKRKISLLLAFAMIATMVFPMMVVNAATQYVPVYVSIKTSDGTTLNTSTNYTNIKAGDKIVVTANCPDEKALYWSQNTYFMSQKGYKANDKGMAILAYKFDSASSTTATIATDPTQVTITIPNFAPGTSHTLDVQGVGAVDYLTENGTTYEATSGWLKVKFTIPATPITGTVDVKIDGASVANGSTTTVATGKSVVITGTPASSFGKLYYAWDSEKEVEVTGSTANIVVPSSFVAGSTHTLLVIGRYTDGNLTGDWQRYTIKIPAAPVTTITTDLKYNNSSLSTTTAATIPTGSNLIMSASSNVGIKQMRYSWDNGSLVTFTQGLTSGTIIVPTSFVAGSTHTLQIQAIATNDTISTAKIYTIKIPAEIIEEDELIIEPWMKETTELDGLAVSLRNDSDEDKGNKNIYMLGEEVQYFVDYKNAGKDITSAVKLVLELPLSADVVESDGGIVSGNEITWNFTNGLEEEQAGTKEVVVKYTSLGKSSIESKVIYPVAQIYKSTKLMDSSAVINLIFKDEDTEIDDTHYPYMFGDEEAPTFRPNDIITRAEGALVLTRIFGINTYGVAITNVYPDLDETYEEAQKAIVAATNMGLINGYTDGTYRPNATMTRAEFMKIIAANVELDAEENDIVGLNIKDSENDIKKYKDTTRSYTVNGSTVSEHWASPYVTLLARLNMTALTSSSRDLRLDENITRAEVAQLVNFYLLRAPAKVNSRTTTDFTDVSRSHKLFADIVEATMEAHTYTLTTEGLEIAE